MSNEDLLRMLDLEGKEAPQRMRRFRSPPSTKRRISRQAQPRCDWTIGDCAAARMYCMKASACNTLCLAWMAGKNRLAPSPTSTVRPLKWTRN